VYYVERRGLFQVTDQPEEPNQAKEPAPALTSIESLAFFAADHVVKEEATGKLHVLGGFYNLLRFAVYPAVVPTLGIGASLYVPWHAYHQDHHFAITMLDEDRQPLPLKIEGGFRLGADTLLGHGDPSVVNIGGTIPTVVFQRPGRYRLWLHVDEQPLDSWRLQLLQLPTGLPSTAASGIPKE
jgi:Family of unknown function (DUF6941)